MRRGGERSIETGRETETEKLTRGRGGRQSEREKERGRGRQTDRQTERGGERQTDRQTERQRESRTDVPICIDNDTLFSYGQIKMNY